MKEEAIKVKTAKAPVVLETLITFGIRLFGLGTLFFAVDIFGTRFFESFQSQYLYSIAFIPVVDIIKQMPQMLMLPFTVSIVLHEDRIDCKTGFYHLFTDSIEVKNIENIESYYSFIGKIFNFKTICIRNYGSYVRLWYVKDGDKIIKLIREREKNIFR